MRMCYHSGYMLFSDVNWQNILIKIGLIGIYVSCVYLFKLIGKDELKYVKNILTRQLIKR